MNRKTGSILRRVLACSLAVTTAFAFGGCGKTEEDESNGKIAVICKAQGVSFWDNVKLGAEDAGEEMGYDIIYNCASQESSIDEQIGFINQAIDEGVKAILIAPNSATELNAALKKAASEGIKIITVNSDVSDMDKERISCVASDNISCGNIAARQVASLINSRKITGSIGIIGHGEKSSTSIERIQGFDEALLSMVFQTWRKTVAQSEGDDMYNELPDVLKTAYAKLPDVTADYEQVKTLLLGGAGISILDPQYCENDRETAKKQAADLIKNNPDLKVLYGTNTNSTLGICDALAESGKKADIIVVGFNSDTAEIDYLRDGTLDGLIVQSPYNMGYLGVRYADKALNGDTVSTLIDTGATYVSMANIENTDVKLLLDPRSAL